MKEAVVRRLLALNRRFYDELAAPFARSRAHPWPGFAQLTAHFDRPIALLDVGCGEGRLGRFFAERGRLRHYTGIDGSAALLQVAADTLPGGTFLQRDIADPQTWDEDFGRFEAVACLATLQHIPGHHNRVHLLRQLAARLAPGGLLLLANWQPDSDPRQQRKTLPWSTIALSPADVEPGDRLISWQRGGGGVRYVAAIDAAETARLAQSADLTILHQFHSDGRTGTLNLYTMLQW